MKTKILSIKVLVIAAAVTLMAVFQVQAEEKEESNQILITNVNVWDRVSDDFKQNVNVLVVGNKIKRIGKIKAPKSSARAIISR